MVSPTRLQNAGPDVLESKGRSMESNGLKRLTAGSLKLEIHESRKSAGEAAASAVAQVFENLDRNGNDISAIFATGASQLAVLEALTAIPGLPWGKIQGFHMDEYVGISDAHPASFRRYMREKLTRRVAMKQFWEIDGNASDLEAFCQEYAERLRAAAPQLCLLGIGENGHLAFNDPEEADFNDPADVKIVSLDRICKQQQVEEGWFGNLDEVPDRAITLSIPALFRVPKLIVSVPGPRKARIVRRALEDPIGTNCPATILRTHPDATLYLDKESAAEIEQLLLLH